MYHYTSVEQSRKLLELGLNPKSADMCLIQKIKYPMATPYRMFEPRVEYVPCWSVGALLEVMPLLEVPCYNSCSKCRPIIEKITDNEYSFKYIDVDNKDNPIIVRKYGKTPIDAAYNGIVWLLDNNYIKKGE